jgi:excinuclease ABC subunit B
MDETNRRRSIQEKHNQDNGITPESVKKAIGKGIERTAPVSNKPKLDLNKIPKDEYKHLIKELSAQMVLASSNLEFEKAAELRDLITEIEEKLNRI